MPTFILTAHAAGVVRERGIEMAWISRTLASPIRTVSDSVDPALRHALCEIAEREGRTLRVVYDPENLMKVHLDEQADALYLRLDESPIVDSEEVQPGIVLDFDAAGQVVGVEIRGVKARAPAANLRQMQFELS